MLTNQPIRPVKNDLDRRWIYDDYFDLIVWYESSGRIHGFQLCYDKEGLERALTWIPSRGFHHSGIDSGESSPLSNQTPMLIPDGEFPFEKVRSEFLARSKTLPAEICDLVLARIAEYERHARA